MSGLLPKTNSKKHPLKFAADTADFNLHINCKLVRQKEKKTKRDPQREDIERERKREIV